MQQNIIGWLGLGAVILLPMIGGIGRIIALLGDVRADMRLMKQSIGDKDGGIVADLHDHEQRIRALERGQIGFSAGAAHPAAETTR